GDRYARNDRPRASDAAVTRIHGRIAVRRLRRGDRGGRTGRMTDFFKPSLLSGRAALVTGGGTGICRGIALALAAAGCDVAITSRSLEHLEPTARDIEACGVRSLAAVADVRRP